MPRLTTKVSQLPLLLPCLVESQEKTQTQLTTSRTDQESTVLPNSPKRSRLLGYSRGPEYIRGRTDARASISMQNLEIVFSPSTHTGGSRAESTRVGQSSYTRTRAEFCTGRFVFTNTRVASVVSALDVIIIASEHVN